MTSADPRSSEPDLPGPFLALGEQLEVATRRSRRGPVALAVAALVVALAGVALLVDSSGQPAFAGVEVERRGSVVTVSIDAEASVDELEQALADKQVSVTVEAKPTGPSLAGRFVGIVGPPDARLGDGSAQASAEVSFPVGSEVTLHLGVAAEPGEAYDVPTEANAPGEPFEGLVLVGRRVDELKPSIEGVAGVTVQYRGPNGQPTDEPSGAATVMSALMFSSDRLVLLLK